MSPGGSAPSSQEANIAKIAVLPNQGIIDKYKGKLDFYLHRGIPCVRKWPLHPPRPPYPAEGANQDLLAYIMHLAPTLPDSVISPYKELAKGKYLRWQDWLVRAYISGIPYINPSWVYPGDIRDLPRFAITDIKVLYLGPYVDIEWWTDIPCRQFATICLKPIQLVIRPKYRRGALWYLDYYLYTPGGYHCDEENPTLGNYHEVHAPEYVPDPPWWVIFHSLRYIPYPSHLSITDTAPYYIPPSPWTP